MTWAKVQVEEIIKQLEARGHRVELKKSDTHHLLYVDGMAPYRIHASGLYMKNYTRMMSAFSKMRVKKRQTPKREPLYIEKASPQDLLDLEKTCPWITRRLEVINEAMRDINENH